MDPEPFLHPSPTKPTAESLIVRCDLGALCRAALDIELQDRLTLPIGFSNVPIVGLWEDTAEMRDELVIDLLRDHTRLSDAMLRPEIEARGFAFAVLFAKIFPGRDPAEQAELSLSL